MKGTLLIWWSRIMSFHFLEDCNVRNVNVLPTFQQSQLGGLVGVIAGVGLGEKTAPE